MKLEVVDINNKKVEDLDLNPEIFDYDLRPDLLQRVVEWQRAKARAGTHKTRTVSEISGTTKKPFKQKGTGNARQGSLRSAQMRGGAVAHGPVVRSYEYSLPKKVKKLALLSALSMKARDGKLKIVSDFNLESNKTADLNKAMQNFGFKNYFVVFGDEVNDNFKKASANLVTVNPVPQIGTNVYDILKHECLVLTKDAVKLLESRLQNA